MKIPVYHYEAISEHEFTTGKNGEKILARDIEPVYPANDFGEKYLLWNGKKRNIKKIKGQWYLITKCIKSIDNKNVSSYTANSSLTERN